MVVIGGLPYDLVNPLSANPQPKGDFCHTLSLCHCTKNFICYKARCQAPNGPIIENNIGQTSRILCSGISHKGTVPC